MTPLELALYYSQDLHLTVVPVNPVSKSALSLNWTNDPKRTYTEKEAHKYLLPDDMIGQPIPFGSGKDRDWIEETWTRFPHALVGIRTGQVNGLVVIDVDKHGMTDGFKAFKKYELKAEATAVISTPGGGQHWYYATPEKLKSGTPFGPGIDLQAEGRMIIGPENRRGGKPYLYLNGHRLTDLAPFPPKLMPLLKRSAAQQKLDKAAADIEGTPVGQQHNKVRDWCWSLAHEVVAGKLDEQEFRQRILDIATLCDPPMDRLDAENSIETALRKIRAEQRSGKGTTAATELPGFEPWDEPVETAELLTSIVQVIQDYVAIDDSQAHAVALWILHCHCIEAFDYTPRLYIHSPVKRCGKTTLMRVVKRLVPRPLSLTGCSASLLFRSIESMSPVLLLDEADNYGLERNEDLRIVFNGGVLRGALIGRTVGDNHDPRFFPIFAPLTFAGINNNKVPGPTLDRAIIIGLRRKLREDRRTRFDRRNVGHLTDIGRQAARFAADNIEALAAAEPKVPASLNDRELDSWRGLLAIADMAGAEWGLAAREAATALSDNDDDDTEPALMLLADCRQIFEDSKATFDDEITSAHLVTKLHALEDRPWNEWGRLRKPITANGVARLLKRYGIRPHSVGKDPNNRPKGYGWWLFGDPWRRYGGFS